MEKVHQSVFSLSRVLFLLAAWSVVGHLIDVASGKPSKGAAAKLAAPEQREIGI